MFEHDLRSDKSRTDQQDSAGPISYDGGKWWISAIDNDTAGNNRDDRLTTNGGRVEKYVGELCSGGGEIRKEGEATYYGDFAAQEQSANRRTNQKGTQIRTTSSKNWFSFDEETLRKSVKVSPSVARFASQGLYSENNRHLVHSDQERAPRECVTSLFCKEPDRLLTTALDGNEAKKNQLDSRSIHSESTKGWAE